LVPLVTSYIFPPPLSQTLYFRLPYPLFSRARPCRKLSLLFFVNVLPPFFFCRKIPFPLLALLFRGFSQKEGRVLTSPSPPPCCVELCLPWRLGTRSQSYVPPEILQFLVISDFPPYTCFMPKAHPERVLPIYFSRPEPVEHVTTADILPLPVTPNNGEYLDLSVFSPSALCAYAPELPPGSADEPPLTWKDAKRSFLHFSTFFSFRLTNGDFRPLSTAARFLCRRSTCFPLGERFRGELKYRHPTSPGGEGHFVFDFFDAS